MSQRTMELMEELGGRGTTLLDVCLNLHMSNTGASDPLSNEYEEKSLKILEISLTDWTPSHFKSQKFDDSVKDLIKATIRETKLRKIEREGGQVSWLDHDKHQNLLKKVDEYIQDQRWDVIQHLIDYCVSSLPKNKGEVNDET